MTLSLSDYYHVAQWRKLTTLLSTHRDVSQ